MERKTLIESICKQANAYSVSHNGWGKMKYLHYNPDFEYGTYNHLDTLQSLLDRMSTSALEVLDSQFIVIASRTTSCLNSLTQAIAMEGLLRQEEKLVTVGDLKVLCLRYNKLIVKDGDNYIRCDSLSNMAFSKSYKVRHIEGEPALSHLMSLTACGCENKEYWRLLRERSSILKEFTGFKDLYDSVYWGSDITDLRGKLCAIDVCINGEPYAMLYISSQYIAVRGICNQQYSMDIPETASCDDIFNIAVFMLSFLGISAKGFKFTMLKEAKLIRAARKPSIHINSGAELAAAIKKYFTRERV